MNTINIAIVHYHLRTGGVRRVIDNTLESLTGSAVNPVIISGSHAPGPDTPPLREGVESACVPLLEYTSKFGNEMPSALANDLMGAARRLLGTPPDIWHFHNHCLGKNPALPGAVRIIAEKGVPVLLQIHDFAEDGRPELYNRLINGPGHGDAGLLSRCLYPAAAHIHYALINSRDRGFVRQAGCEPGNSHLLANPVSFGNCKSQNAKKRDSNLVLYPTRAIRRKNVGEMLLWAAIMGNDLRFGLTRGPKNPEHKKIYDRWVTLSSRLNLPLEFEMGEKIGLDFEELYNSAYSIITTSVAEGFGLSFLEPFLAGNSVCGRLLPEITADFDSQGIKLSNLYDKLMVPVDMVGAAELKVCIKKTMKKVFADYNQEITPEIENRAIQDYIQEDKVDFGRLNETFQEKVVDCCSKSREVGNMIDPDRLFFTKQHIIDNNRRIIEEEFSLEKYGKRLWKLYKSMGEESTNSHAVSSLSAPKLLNCFLAPERFSLIKT